MENQMEKKRKNIISFWIPIYGHRDYAKYFFIAFNVAVVHVYIWVIIWTFFRWIIIFSSKEFLEIICNLEGKIVYYIILMALKVIHTT